MQTSGIVIWGGTGHARVIWEALGDRAAQVMVVADARDIPSPLTDVALISGRDAFERWHQALPVGTKLEGVVAIGGHRGVDRLEVMNYLEGLGASLPVIVHTRAFVATTAQINAGSQVLAMAAVCASAQLGRGVIVNTAASVDHDCVIGDGVHLGPGVRLAGEVVVGPHAFIGTGAIVLPRLRIGSGAIVGAGSIVTRDVPDGAVVLGQPARPR